MGLIMKKNSRTVSLKIGILDWGIGGLSVLKKIIENQKSCMNKFGFDIVYFSDSGSIPYGKLSVLDLRSRLEKIFQTLQADGVSLIIVACNAASTVIINETHYQEIPIINVISPTIEYCKNLADKNLGIIGGQRTIDSNIYKVGIERDSKIKVYQSVAQPLSALIEQGKIQKIDVAPYLEPIMDPLLLENISSLVLACTHYPALNPLITELYPQLTLINPADFVFSKMLDLSLISEDLGSTKDLSYIKYKTTGDQILMRTSAKLAFQWEINTIETVLLN